MKRLPRRFDAPMKALRELSESKNEKIRLQAALRMSDILLAHLESEQRTLIAIERAVARQRESEAMVQPYGTDTPASALEDVDTFIARIKAEQQQRENQANE
jgi:hypothetical protein